MFISVLPFNFQCVFPLPVLYTKPFIQLLLDHHTHYKFHPIHRDTCRIGHKLVGHTGRKIGNIVNYFGISGCIEF